MPLVLSFVLLAAPLDPSVLTVPFVEATSTPQEIWTRDKVKAYALEQATKYGLHKQRFLAVIQCENKFDATGQSQHYYKGVREKSFGAVQIHLPSHPGITREMAEDPEFAIPWMAKKWLQGDANLWSCYTDLYGQSM